MELWFGDSPEIVVVAKTSTSRKSARVTSLAERQEVILNCKDLQTVALSTDAMVDVFALHHALDTFVHSVALFLNMGLAHVIMRRSHGSLRAYKGIFMLTCVNDILLSAVALIAQTVGYHYDSTQFHSGDGLNC